MEIIKSKRKSKCEICWKLITQKYKVKVGETRYCHLSCYYRRLKNRLENTKKLLKQFSKQKYKRQMILEAL